MLQVKVFTFNPFQENTYILYNEQKQCIIIDAGNYFPYEDVQLKSFITSEGLIPQLLVNTHCHIDHVLGISFARSEWNIPLTYHPIEEEILDRLEQSALMYGIHAKPFARAESHLSENKLKIGDDELEILFTPGHCPGHICLYAPREGFVIAGDTLFEGSIGRTDLYKGNHAQLIQSIHQHLLSLPPETIVYSGHGPSTSIGIEKMNNPFLVTN
jgi:glyoxylase-like metal-dependent hydrolase (beta-lactamase superfamily II)